MPSGETLHLGFLHIEGDKKPIGHGKARIFLEAVATPVFSHVIGDLPLFSDD